MYGTPCPGGTMEISPAPCAGFYGRESFRPEGTVEPIFPPSCLRHEIYIHALTRHWCVWLISCRRSATGPKKRQRTPPQNALFVSTLPMVSIPKILQFAEESWVLFQKNGSISGFVSRFRPYIRKRETKAVGQSGNPNPNGIPSSSPALADGIGLRWVRAKLCHLPRRG